jgi:hypothetical protein
MFMSVFGAVPPPRKDDILFGWGADCEMSACIDHWGGDAYTPGYRRAARLLAETACSSRHDHDTLIYPIVYLYRHHIELVLKSITYAVSEILNKTLTRQETNILEEHKLSSIWRTVRPMLNVVCSSAQHDLFPDDDLEGIDSYIRQLHEFDPDGTRFRYARTKKGQRSLAHKEAVTVINIASFADMLEKLADYLDGIDNWLATLT